MSDTLDTGSIDLERRRRFVALVAELEHEIESILDTEAASSGTRYHSDGVSFQGGGSWRGYTWKPEDVERMIDIKCQLAEDEPWRVVVHWKGATFPTQFLRWPTDDFRSQLTDALSTLRS